MRRLVRSVAILAVGLVAASACGDDDGSATDTDATGTTAPPATTAAASTTTSTTVVDDVQLLVVLNPDGIGFTTEGSGSISRLDFGSDATLVRDTVAKSLGAPVEEAPQPECGQGPRDSSRWDELTLLADGSAFVGWSIGRGSPLTTLDGVGIGSTLGELESALGAAEVTDGSLGREFTAGPYFGILDDDADVVDFLSAGEICAFR